MSSAARRPRTPRREHGGSRRGQTHHESRVTTEVYFASPSMRWWTPRAPDRSARPRNERAAHR
jgi:hypothetical protein